MVKRDTGAESQSGKRELEGEMERVAVVCKRTCVFSIMSGSVFEKGFEEEVVGLLGDEKCELV